MRDRRSAIGWLVLCAASLLAGMLAARWAPAVAQVAPAAAVVEVVVRDLHGKPLADAAVYLESPAARAAPEPPADGRIVQQQRAFLPPVTVVRVGSRVRFPNEDTVRHHVYSFSPARTFELKLYIGTPAEPVLFDKVGTAVLGCNIHDQMIAWVHVVDTPYFARTDAQGRARIAGVPPGDYRLRTWHPGQPEPAPPGDTPVRVGAASLTLETRLDAAGLPTP